MLTCPHWLPWIRAPRTRAPVHLPRNRMDTTDVSIKIHSKSHKRRRSSISTGSDRDTSENKNRPVYSDLYQQTWVQVWSHRHIHDGFWSWLLRWPSFSEVYSTLQTGHWVSNTVRWSSLENPRDKNSSLYGVQIVTPETLRQHTKCEINFMLVKTEPPIFVNYRLTRFYQNYQSYFLSRWMGTSGRPEDGTGCPGEARMVSHSPNMWQWEHTLRTEFRQTHAKLRPCVELRIRTFPISSEWNTSQTVRGVRVFVVNRCFALGRPDRHDTHLYYQKITPTPNAPNVHTRMLRKLWHQQVLAALLRPEIYPALSIVTIARHNG